MDNAQTNLNAPPSVNDLVYKEEDERLKNYLSDSNIPRDAKIMATLLKTSGISEYDPKVINQLLEFMYRYLVDVLSDADDYREHASKANIDLDDVRLAIQSQLSHSFVQPTPRQVMLEMARVKNSQPLPAIPVVSRSSCVILPTERLATPSFQVEPFKQESQPPQKPLPTQFLSQPLADIKVNNEDQAILD